MEKNAHIVDTNYYVATHWLGNSLILCNNIAEIDNSVWDNFLTMPEENEEIMQWFLTNCSEDDVEFLTEHFGLIFTYSELLDMYILCVTHWGTSWDYVYWTADFENAKAELGDKLNR